MRELLLLLPNGGVLHKIVGTVVSQGGRVLQRYGPSVVLVEADESLRERLPLDLSENIKIFSDSVPESEIPTNDVSAQMGIAAWNERHTQRFLEDKLHRPGRGLSWGDFGFDPEGETNSE